jgi:hypothetical protein
MADPVEEQIDNQEFFETFEPAITPKLLTRTYIDYPYLSELKDENFNTESSTMINMIDYGEKAYFVLFMDQTPESQRYLKMWLKIAEQIKNEYCEIAFCNIRFEKKIDDSFRKLSKRRYISHPFFWARYRTTPFALVYRDGWPQGFYNGGFFFQDILNFCATEISDETKPLDKYQKIRPGYARSIRQKETELLQDLERDRKKEESRRKMDQLKKTNPKDEVISHAVSFD